MAAVEAAIAWRVMMTNQLTPHVARTLTDGRLRSAAERRARQSAAGPRGDRDAGARRALLSDQALERIVTAAAAGDARAWAWLQDRFGARIRAVARCYRLAPHDVEDVAQATWLRLLEHIGGIHDANAVGAWLETTARHESLRLLRHAKRERPTDDRVLAERPTEAVAEGRLVTAERRAALDAALRQLPGRQRRLLREMLADPTASYTEISATLDMPIGSIGPTRQRSLARLRRDRELVSVIGEDVFWQSSAPSVV
jgi:RNA polymerase sigma factor (sigma-70 family)